MVLVSNFRHNQEVHGPSSERRFPEVQGISRLRSAEPVNTGGDQAGHKRARGFSSPTTQETSLDRLLVELQILLRLYRFRAVNLQMEKLGIMPGFGL